MPVPEITRISESEQTRCNYDVHVLGVANELKSTPKTAPLRMRKNSIGMFRQYP